MKATTTLMVSLAVALPAGPALANDTADATKPRARTDQLAPGTGVGVGMSGKAGITGLDKAKRRADGAWVVEGTLAGEGVIPGPGRRVIRGKVAPGNSPGCVTDQGHVTFEGSAWLEIELGGPAACSGYDQYTVNLSLTLNSPRLEVSLFGGFVPEAGQSFDILNWGTLSGAFGVVNLPALPAGLSWDQSQLHTHGVLTVLGPESSDADVPLPLWAVGLMGAGILAPLLRRDRHT